MNMFTSKALDKLHILKEQVIKNPNFCNCKDHQYCICTMLDKVIDDLKWHSIDTAPHDRYIIITDGICLPDIVGWKGKVPVHDGTRYVERPAGWFCSNGGRSRFDTDVTMKAQFWKDI